VILLVACALLALVIALARGGDIAQLAQVRFRAGWVALAALALQIATFSGVWSRSPLSRWTPLVYTLSMMLLVLVAGLNWRVPGMIAIGAGLLSNTLAIALNGGRMPVSPTALRIAGLEGMNVAAGLGSAANSVVVDGTTRVPFLCDILALPGWLPLRNVFSVGDVLIALGAVWFFLAVIRPRPTT